MRIAALTFRQVRPADEGALALLFGQILEHHDDAWFHPHPFTAAQAAVIAGYSGRDFYGVAVDGETTLAYGMLRGWDQGYDVPSLGIVVSPAARGTGLARAFMHYLHATARLRGCKQVRLSVYENNVRAHRLYSSLGYDLHPHLPGQLVGYCRLESAA